MESPEAKEERSVFIEMDEYIEAEHKWVETHRWNYGMEEDLFHSLFKSAWSCKPLPLLSITDGSNVRAHAPVTQEPIARAG